MRERCRNVAEQPRGRIRGGQSKRRGVAARAAVGKLVGQRWQGLLSRSFSPAWRWCSAGCSWTPLARAYVARGASGRPCATSDRPAHTATARPAPPNPPARPASSGPSPTAANGRRTRPLPRRLQPTLDAAWVRLVRCEKTYHPRHQRHQVARTEAQDLGAGQVAVARQQVRVRAGMGGLGNSNVLSSPAPQYPEGSAAIRRHRAGRKTGPSEGIFSPRSSIRPMGDAVSSGLADPARPNRSASSRRPVRISARTTQPLESEAVQQ